MKGLILKDWKILRRQGHHYGMALLLICAIAFVGSKNFSSFITSYLTFMITMFAISSFNYDEYENGMAFLISMPSGRRGYVSAKYIFSILLIFSGWLLGSLIRMVFFLLRFSAAEYLEILPEEPVYLSLCLIYISFVFPVLIKYGAEKGRNIAFMILLVVCIGAFLISRLKLLVSVFAWFFALLEKTPFAAALFLLGICIAVLSISYGLSLWIIKKKEF